MHTLWRHLCVSTGISFDRYNSCPYGHHCPGLLIPSVINRSKTWQRQPVAKCLGNSNRRHRRKVLILTSKIVEVVTPSRGGCEVTGLRHTEGAPWAERCCAHAFFVTYMHRLRILCYLHASATHSLLPTCTGYAFFITYMHRLRILCYLHASATHSLLPTCIGYSAASPGLTSRENFRPASPMSCLVFLPNVKEAFQN